MKKMMIYSTLNLNITKKNNLLNKKSDEGISEDVLDKLFESKTIIYSLNIMGGETFADLQSLIKVIKTIVDRKVIICYATITTNGTMYNENVEKILKEFEEYIFICNCMYKGVLSSLSNLNIYLNYSSEELNALKHIKFTKPRMYINYLFNIKKLKKSSFYKGEQKLNDDNTLEMYYLENDYGFNANNLSVDVNGNIFKNSSTDKLIYGNILSDGVIPVVEENGTKCLNELDMNQKVDSEISKLSKKI